MMRNFLFLIIILMLTCFNSIMAEEKPIKRSMDDKCKYFEVSQSKDGDIVTMITRQDCPTWGNTWSLVEYDCASKEYKFIGESSKGPDQINKKNPDKKFTSLVPGSSKSDTWTVACKK